MAARALHKAPQTRRAKAKRGGKRSTSWKPGQSGNPGGRTKAQVATEKALRDLAQAFGSAPDPDDPDGRSRGIVALDELFKLGKGGNVQALTGFCDRVGLKPIERVEGTVDIGLTIRKRVLNADDDGHG